MAKTAQFALPLIAPAQAQKHVTVNEALARLDALAQLRVVSAAQAAPPATCADGSAYLIPGGATGDWDGQTGQIAIRSNGGWVFLAPKAGWRAWDEDRFTHLTFDGQSWVADATSVSAGGAATRHRIIEFDHAVVAGASQTTGVAIPSGAQVVGVTGRVIAPITGDSLTGWRVGVAGSDNRYGSGLGLALNSFVAGLSGSPVTYYATTPLLLSAEGGNFAGGAVRFALHVVELEVPGPV